MIQKYFKFLFISFLISCNYNKSKLIIDERELTIVKDVIVNCDMKKSTQSVLNRNNIAISCLDKEFGMAYILNNNLQLLKSYNVKDTKNGSFLIATENNTFSLLYYFSNALEKPLNNRTRYYKFIPNLNSAVIEEYKNAILKLFGSANPEKEYFLNYEAEQKSKQLMGYVNKNKELQFLSFNNYLSFVGIRPESITTYIKNTWLLSSNLILNSEFKEGALKNIKTMIYLLDPEIQEIKPYLNLYNFFQNYLYTVDPEVVSAESEIDRIIFDSNNNLLIMSFFIEYHSKSKTQRRKKEYRNPIILYNILSQKFLIWEPANKIPASVFFGADKDSFYFTQMSDIHGLKIFKIKRPDFIGSVVSFV